MKMTDAEFEKQYVEATKRGEECLRTQPRAVSVKFDRRYSRLVVKLNNGMILTVPTSLVPELKGLKPDDLAQVAVLGAGFDLDWEHLDIQVSVAWLLTGLYPPSSFLSVIGRRGGSSKSKAKAAARANGSQGGRPRRKRTTSVR